MRENAMFLRTLWMGVALAVVASPPGVVRAGEDSSPQASNSSSRAGSRIGASSFGPGGASSGSAVAPAPGTAPPGNPPGGGFPGRYAGTPGGNSDPAAAQNSRATIGTIGPSADDDSIDPFTPQKRTFPNRIGNTELHQWDIGAGVAMDPSYAMWGAWALSSPWLWFGGMENPMMMGMGMGMGGMGMAMPAMAQYGAGGGNIYGPPLPGNWNGANPAATANNPPSGPATNASDSSASINGRANDTRVPDPPRANPAPRQAVVPPPPEPGLTKDIDPAAAERARLNSDKGEAAFRAGDYKTAVSYWKHAVVDDPQNGMLTMLLAQSLFATGQFNAAAGATQTAMRLLPEDKWGTVIEKRAELYAETRTYLDQLLALDKAAKSQPNDPSLRFLAGFHYAYLGYPKAALDNLEKGLKLAPQDELAHKLRDDMQAKLPAPAAPTPQPPEPADSRPAKTK